MVSAHCKKGSVDGRLRPTECKPVQPQVYEGQVPNATHGNGLLEISCWMLEGNALLRVKVLRAEGTWEYGRSTGRCKGTTL